MFAKSKTLTKHNETSSDADSRRPLILPGDVEYLAVLILATGLNLLPSATRSGVIDQLSRAVSTLWYKANRGTVRRVRHHLQVLFKYGRSDTRLESLVRNQLVLASWNALVVNLLPSLRDNDLAGLMQIEGLRHIDRVHKQGKAALLLGFHYGAYGYAVAAALTARDYPTRLVAYGNSHSPRVGASRLYQRLYWPRVQRLAQKIKIITVDPGADSQPALRDVLEQRHEIIHLLADQYFIIPPGEQPPSHLVPLRLLDHTIHLDVSGVQLAKEMGAQPLTAIPVGDSFRQRVLIEPMEWASDGATTADIAQDLQIYVSRLERQLLKYPAWWRDLRRTDLLARMGMSELEEATDG